MSGNKKIIPGMASGLSVSPRETKLDIDDEGYKLAAHDCLREKNDPAPERQWGRQAASNYAGANRPTAILSVWILS